MEDPSLVESIHYRDEDVNRLYFMMFRILKSALKDRSLLSQWDITAEKVLALWYLIINIESISDLTKSITLSLAKQPKFDKKGFAELQDALRQLYIKVMKAYYASDKQAAQEVASQYVPFTERCDDFFKKNKSIEAATILHNCRELYSAVCNIARIVIDEDKNG